MRDTRPSLGRTLLIAFALIMGWFASLTTLTMGAGFAAALFVVFTKSGGGALPPEEKARILAQHISLAMNLTAAAFVVATAIVGIVWYRRVRKRRADEG